MGQIKPLTICTKARFEEQTHAKRLVKVYVIELIIDQLADDWIITVPALGRYFNGN